MNGNKIYLLSKEKLIFFTLIIFYFLGYILNEDGSGSGQHDYLTYLLKTQEQISYNFSISFFEEGFSGYTPLHFILYSPLYKLFGQDFLRLGNFFISLLVIYIFYRLLKKKFALINSNQLILISTLPIIDPYFRSSAFWFQNEITGIFFFLISINYFLNYSNENRNFSYFNKNIFLSFIFCSLAFYTKQNYIFFTIFYYLYFIIKINRIANFLILTSLNLVLYLPFIYFSLKFNSLAPGSANEVFSFSLDNIFIFFSFLSFYLLPFFILRFKIAIIKKYIRELFISFIVVIIYSFFFNYDNNIGGGVFFKISNLIFKNNILFFISSALGLFFFVYIFNYKNLSNKLIFIPILIIIIFLKVPFQEYLAIYFFYIYFLILDKELANDIFEKFNIKLTLIYFYFISFLIGSIAYNNLNLKYLL